MRMSCGLTDNIDDPSILLLPHDWKHSLDHEKKAENFVAQLSLENLACRCIHGTAQVGSSIVDENIYPPERLVGSGNKLLHCCFIGNVGGHSQNAAFSRIVFAL